jgi:uncharacterized protein (DUF342 family)
MEQQIMGLKPGDYKLEVSDDRMIATLILLNRDLPDKPSVDDLREVLRTHGIVSGISGEQLTAMQASPAYGESFVVARGRTPPLKVISEVTYGFDPGPMVSQSDLSNPRPASHEQDCGPVDLKNVRVFQNVQAGDELVRRTVITPAMCGEDVFGNPIEPEFSKATRPKPGRGVKEDEQSGTITALVTGHADLTQGKVNVMESLDISGDVDYSVGNIDFVGDLKILGSVHPGFHVRAGRSLTINGNVDRAHIACAGDLTVIGIVFGAGETTINVDGNAAISALDQCEINVRGDLSVTNYMRHCTARVGGNLDIVSKKGNLVGGEVQVYRHVEVTSLGSRMAALTKLTVGRNPFAEHNPDELRTELFAQEKKLKQIMLGIEALRKRMASLGPEPSLNERLEKLMLAQEQYVPKLEELRSQLAEAQRNAVYFRESRISVRDTVHPGVVVNFRDRLQYKTMDSLSHMCFYERDSEIKTRSL